MPDLYKAISSSIGEDIDEDIEIRTGEITADNGDGTYDVKIANADSAYPNVETLEYGATFSISEIVVIGFEYGCKESPKILGSAKKIAQEPKIVEVDYSGGARVKTLNAYSTTETTTYLNGEISITANIIGNCTRRGFHYGTDTDYGSPDEYEDGSFGAGTYTLQITDLTANTTYHYQAYVIDANGDEQVGEDKTFTTSVAIAGYIFVYCWTAEDSYCIKSYTASGAYVKTFSVSELQDWNNVLAVDANNNVYCVHYQLLKCFDKDGNLLYQTASDYITAVCVGPDSHIYTDESIDAEAKIAKRAIGSETIIESKICVEQAVLLSQGLIMDSNKNIYLKKSTYSGSVKYNYPDSGDLVLIASNDSIDLRRKTLAIVNGVLAIGDRGSTEIKTAKLDLSAYINESLDIATITKPIGVGNIGNDFILCAYDNANDYAVVGRYESDGTAIWETNIGTYADTTPYQVAAYPF